MILLLLLVCRHDWSEDLHNLLMLMMQKGVELDSQNVFLESALHHAASRGKKEAVTFLVQNGADVNMQNKYDSMFHACA